jgi:hypothetical protein
MSNQIQATGAVKIRSLTGALTASSGVVNSVPLGGANGVATLDSNGKVPVNQLPSSVMEYKGTWNAATNTPTLANGTGDPGDVYICNVAGTANFGAGPIVFATGDWVVYNGSIWQKSGGGSGLYVPYSGATNDVNLNTKNLFTNNVFEGFSSVAASGVQIVLTVASTPNYLITGSGGQTIKLPDATTLPNGSVYVFNNNQSSGAITVNNNSNTLVVSIPSGGYCNLELIDNSIAAGSWDRHFQAPSNVSWSTNTFDYPGSITSATWNGNTVAINRGGTGATTAITALANLGGTPLTRLISTTAPLLGGGDLTADRTLSITQASTSTNGYLSSTDWNTFNEKTGGSGTLNYVPKFTGIGKTLGNSLIYDYGTGVVIGDTTSSYFFDVNGRARFRSNVTIGDSTISQPGLIIAAGSANQSIQFFNAAGGISGGGYGVLTVSGTTTSVNYKFSTWNTTNAFYIQDDGNIGIGTPVPNYKLDVSGTGNFTGQLKLGSTITNGTYTYTLPSLTGTLVVSSQITGTANYISKFSSTGLVNSLLWDNGTNVGVGNTNTTYTFDVTGTGRFTGSLTGTNANFNYVSFNNSASAAPTITGFSSLTFIANSSFLNMNIKRADGQNSSLRFPSDGFTHQYDLPTSDGTLALTSQITGTTNYLSKFTSTGLANSAIYEGTSGYISIGNTNSTYNLDVTGTGRFTSSLQVANIGVGYAAQSNINAFIYQSAGSGSISCVIQQDGTGNILQLSGNGGANRLTVTQPGNVGIGTSSPSSLLTVQSSSSGSAPTYLALNNTGTGVGTGGGYQLQSSGTSILGFDWNFDGNFYSTISAYQTLVFKTNASSERMRIATGGNVGIGTTSPISPANNYRYLHIEGSDSSSGGVLYLSTLSNTNSSQIYTNSSGLNINTNTSLPIIFSPAGTEKMRITSAGDVLVGTSSSIWATTNRRVLELNGVSSVLYGIQINGTSGGYLFHSGSDINLVNLKSGVVTVVAGSNGVLLNSGATSWTSNSDERLKNINYNIDNALDKLMTLRTVNFSWKSDISNKENLGLIAQDVEKVFPQVIEKNKLQVKPNETQIDETEYLGVKYTDLIPVLVKAIQELEARLKTLENK